MRAEVLITSKMVRILGCHPASWKRHLNKLIFANGVLFSMCTVAAITGPQRKTDTSPHLLCFENKSPKEFMY